MNPVLVSLYDYEALASRTLPHDVWDFIDAGAMDEVTTRRNRSALEALGEIVGETTPEDVLDRIFDSFCIGK